MRIVLVATLLFVVLASIGNAADRPNVLLICVDDLKPLLGCYGNTIAKTPQIDKLAGEGVRFDRAYCNQAVCSPSRNALLTGLRPQTLGIYDLATNFRKAAPDAVTLPQHFKANGYRTVALGKIFHTGHGNINDEASWSDSHWRPKAPGYALRENRRPLRKAAEKAVQKAAGRKVKSGPAFESADVSDSAYPDGQLADEAIERIKGLVEAADQPFFLAVGFTKPHLPFCAPKKYWDLYDRNAFELPAVRSAPEGAPAFAPTKWGELRNYANIPDRGELPEDLQRELIHGYHAAVSFTDAQIGRVLEALRANGLAENTIIVLWGDHGWHLGDHGMWCKHSNYEQATRIPLVVVAPGTTKRGVASSAFVESVDVYPTLCELAGLPALKGLDGVSFQPALKDPSASVREGAIHVYPRGNRIGQAVRTDRYRLVEWKRPGADDESAIVELYDYQDDPNETRNVAPERPEAVATLRAMLARHPKPKAPLANGREDVSKAAGL